MRPMEKELQPFTADGDVPTIWRMDNEGSGEIKCYRAKHDIKLELASPENQVEIFTVHNEYVLVPLM